MAGRRSRRPLPPFLNIHTYTIAMAEKTRYSDEELQEFKEIILEKLEKAQRDFEVYRNEITHGDVNDTQDTSPTFHALEEGQSLLSKEDACRMAERQQKFIANLKAALV